MKTKPKIEKVSIPIKSLERIAEFYEFPMAVFFAPESRLKKLKGTRNDLFFKSLEVLDKIEKLIEEYRGLKNEDNQ